MNDPIKPILEALLGVLSAFVMVGTSCLSSGCSDAARTQQMIDVANQSGATYNITVAGKPGLEFDLGNRFALTTGTTVTANLTGGFKPGAAGSVTVPADLTARWEAIAEDLRVLLERVAALENKTANQ